MSENPDGHQVFGGLFVQPRARLDPLYTKDFFCIKKLSRYSDTCHSDIKINF